MDSQFIAQQAIQKNAPSGSYVLRGRGLQVQEAPDRDTDNGRPVTEALAQLPGVNLAFGLLKSWQEEFSPRVYGNAPVLIKVLAPGGDNDAGTLTGTLTGTTGDRQ